MAKTLRIVFLTGAAALLVMGCESQDPAEQGAEPHAVQEAAAAEQPAADETATARGAATAEAGEAIACPHAKAGGCPKAGECDGDCSDCPHAKAGGCPKAGECDGDCSDCPHAKADGECCKGAKEGGAASACPHAKAADGADDGGCCAGAEAKAGGEATACPHAEAAEAADDGGCCAGAEAKADHADEANCPFGAEEAGAKEAEGHACGGHGAGTVAEGADGAHFGARFSVAEGEGLAAVLSDEAALPDAPVRVRGTIDEVCQKAGCWFVLKDGEATARITMGHAFTVPKDSKGRKAEVEGTVTVRTFTEDQVKHLEADRGGDPSEVSGSRKEFVLEATGATIEG